MSRVQDVVHARESKVAAAAAAVAAAQQQAAHQLALAQHGNGDGGGGGGPDFRTWLTKYFCGCQNRNSAAQ